MKKKILTAITIASCFAFFNCSDDSTSGPNPNEGGLVPPLDTNVALPENPSEILPIDTIGVNPLPSNPGDVNDSIFVNDPDEPINPDAPVENPAESSSSLVESSSSEMIESSSSIMLSSSSVIESSSSEKIEEPVQPTGPILSLVKGADENKDGPYKVNRIEKTGPDGGAIWAYPDVSEDPNVKYPVVIWGPGGGTEPGAYGGIINRLASHGFVVLALSSSPGDASKAIAAINWLEEKGKQEGALKGRMILDKVGCSGHSMGGLESEQALLKDKRVYTAILNNSGDLGHSAMSQIKSGKPIAIVYGEGGMERPNAEADYNNSGVTTPACLIKMTGGQGNECQNGECGWGHGSGPWGGMAATVAWMHWHLGGEENRKADFVGASGKYINGPIVGESGNWKGTCKNF